jgi:hypothetical protein
MDIHKPKPIHGWREFLKEVGIIVLSICIALAAEQIVEYFHWRSEVSIARTAIQAEMTTNNRFYARRIAIGPCVDRMVLEARGIIDSLEHKQAPKPFTVFHSGAGTLLSDSEWQSERSSQVLTHFPREELAIMGRYYAQLPQFTAWMNDESTGWSELAVLNNPPAGLSADAIARLRNTLERDKRLAFLILLNSKRMLNLVRPLDLQAGPVPQVNAFCTLGDEQLQAMQLKAEDSR